MTHPHKPVIQIKVLPGEPTDGTGRICIHLFVPDAKGPFIEPHVLHPAHDEEGQPIKGQMSAKATRGRLACDPRRKVAPTTNKGVTAITVRTDDAQAVTCPECKASQAYLEVMETLSGPSTDTTES